MTMKRGPREKFNHARRKILVDFHYFSISSGKFKKCSKSLKEKKRKKSLSNWHLTSLSDGLINLQLSLTIEGPAVLADIVLFWIVALGSQFPLLLEDLLRNTMFSVALGKHLGRSKMIFQIASYRGPCSAGYDEGVRRLRSRRASIRWETTHFSSSERERLRLPYHRETHPPFFCAHRAKRE